RRLLDMAGELDSPVEAEACNGASSLGRGALVRANEHQPELGVSERERLDRNERVLPRLESPDEEEEGRLVVADSPVGAEDVVDAVRDDGDLPLVDVVMLDQVSLRPGGDRNDAVRPPNGTRHHRPEEEAVARSHELRLTLERKVVDRHNGGRCETGSDDVLEVCDRRLQAAQQAGE